MSSSTHSNRGKLIVFDVTSMNLCDEWLPDLSGAFSLLFEYLRRRRIFFIYTSTALTKVCFLYTRLCLISISNDTSIATSARRVLRIKTWESSLPHSMLQLLGFLDEWPVALTGLLQVRRRKNDARRS